MIVYHETKKRFSEDAFNGVIAEKVKQKLFEKGIHDNNEKEFNAWDQSMHFMKEAIDDPHIPDDVDVSIEYEVPLTSKRVDFILTGSDEQDEDNIIIVELKQWTAAEKVNDLERHTVRTYVAGAKRDVAHPCYQAYSYKVHIANYAEAASDPHLHLIPCAYCHNFREEDRPVLEDPIYKPWLEQAPLFLKRDASKLRTFIASKISKKSKRGDLLYEIDNGRIRPAKALQDCLASLLKGKREFLLLDEQATVYDKCVKAYEDCNEDEQKRVVIVQGGPGTGKSVLAVNLLKTFIDKRGNAAYVTKNSAPRKCYLTLLGEDDISKKVAISDLFRSPFRLSQVPKDAYDCLLIDEAHRLVKKMYGDWSGENQVKECIAASKCTIFFIDETQRISVKDIGTVDEIVKQAKALGIPEDHILLGDDYKLTSEFRCNGSDAYVSFLNHLLGLETGPIHDISDLEFDFKVFNDPCEMREELRKKNTNNKARMVAGYCYDWNVKNHRGDWDIVLENGFKAKWNLQNKSELWAIRKDSFDEVGCIHTCQGLEFDYVGVIIGKDLLYRNGQVITDKNAVSSDDKSSGIRSCKDLVLADQLIRNTYKVMLTRGQKGCYVYCEDPELREYLKQFSNRVERQV